MDFGEQRSGCAAHQVVEERTGLLWRCTGSRREDRLHRVDVGSQWAFRAHRWEVRFSTYIHTCGDSAGVLVDQQQHNKFRRAASRQEEGLSWACAARRLTGRARERVYAASRRQAELGTVCLLAR